MPERESRRRRKWSDKPASHKRAAYGTRRRVRGDRGKRLGRLRSEYVERSFAHVCETGGARRSWLRGLEDVTKRHLMVVAGKNPSVILRASFGVGKPRTLQAQGPGGFSASWRAIAAVLALLGAVGGHLAHRQGLDAFFRRKPAASNEPAVPRRIPAAA